MEQIGEFSQIEVRLLVTARKIRQFKEAVAQQRQLGVSDELLESSVHTVARLEEEFKQLSNTLLAVPA